VTEVPIGYGTRVLAPKRLDLDTTMMLVEGEGDIFSAGTSTGHGFSRGELTESFSSLRYFPSVQETPLERTRRQNLSLLIVVPCYRRLENLLPRAARAPAPFCGPFAERMASKAIERL
jgi:hypothetical protein